MSAHTPTPARPISATGATISADHFCEVPASGTGSAGRRSLLRLAAVAVALTVGLTLSACGGDDDADGDSSPDSAPSAAVDSTGGDNSGNDADPDDADDNGRAFGSDDDAVITAVLAATDADRAEWDGKTLVVHFTEGSSEDPVSGTKCAATIVLADDENAVLRFPDGEIDCSQR